LPATAAGAGSATLRPNSGGRRNIRN
jgi:hypothetical protein